MPDTPLSAALALAETRPKNKHGQLCPVWTQRLRKVRHAVTIADCDCWILGDARVDAAIAIAAEQKRIEDEVRRLAFWTPEVWAEHRGGDPIARTINAVFDIIERGREPHDA